MLEETYKKFKQQLLARKTGDTQLPDIVEIADEQVHHLCSYNHYYVKNENLIETQGHNHNHIYDTDELNHEYEYGIYEDILKTEQLMADIKHIDDEEKAAAEEFKQEFDNFPLSKFWQAGQIAAPADPGLCEAAESELYALEQLVLQQLQNDNSNTVDRVSHVQPSQQHVEAEHNYHVHTVNCPMYVPYNDEKQIILIPLLMDMSQKDNTKSLYETLKIQNGIQLPTLRTNVMILKHFIICIMISLSK